MGVLRLASALSSFARSRSALRRRDALLLLVDTRPASGRAARAAAVALSSRPGRRSRFLGQREDPLRDDGELALAAGHVVAAILDAGFQLGQPLALAGHRGQAGGRDVVRQAERAEPGLPIGQRRGVLFLGQFQPPLGRP